MIFLARPPGQDDPWETEVHAAAHLSSLARAPALRDWLRRIWHGVDWEAGNHQETRAGQCAHRPREEHG